jgi:hypothetical protein
MWPKAQTNQITEIMEEKKKIAKNSNSNNVLSQKEKKIEKPHASMYEVRHLSDHSYEMGEGLSPYNWRPINV